MENEILKGGSMERILAARILPAVVIERVEDGPPIARALLAGGLPVMEVPLRTPVALDAIRRIRDEVPEMFIGAATIVRPDQIDQALGAGAEFGVAAGLNETVVHRAQMLGLPFIPGVMTPSEVERAFGLGCTLLKLFPASIGGIDMIKALAGPYAQFEIRLIPMGGVTAANAATFLAHPMVGALGGTWLTPPAMIAAKDWAGITALAKEAVGLAGQGR